jgi:antitoxin VapB
MADVKIAKLSRTTTGQVVQLPEGFAFDGDEVYATRDEDTGDVTLSTKQNQRYWQDLFARIDSLGISDEDADAFGKIMDEIVADRSNHIPDARGVFADELNLDEE